MKKTLSEQVLSKITDLKNKQSNKNIISTIVDNATKITNENKYSFEHDIKSFAEHIANKFGLNRTDEVWFREELDDFLTNILIQQELDYKKHNRK